MDLEVDYGEEEMPSYLTDTEFGADLALPSVPAINPATPDAVPAGK